jgi:hypothetical protein
MWRFPDAGAKRQLISSAPDEDRRNWIFADLEAPVSTRFVAHTRSDRKEPTHTGTFV